MGKSVLVVDDSALPRALVKRALERNGHFVQLCADAADVLDALASRAFDVAVVDMIMPGVDGPTLCRQIRQRHPTGCPRLILLTSADIGPDQLSNLNVDAVAPKDGTLSALVAAVGAG